MNVDSSTPRLGGSGSSSGQGAALAPPFEPMSVSSSSSTVKEEATPSNPVDRAGVDDKKKGKRRSLFSFGKKKNDQVTTTAAATAATAATTALLSAATSSSTPNALPQPAVTAKQSSASSKALPPQPPKNVPSKDTPTRKPTVFTQADATPPASSTFGGGSSTISTYGTYHVLPPSSPGRSVAGLSSSPRISSPAGSQIFERDVQESILPNSLAIPSHIATENYIPPVLDASSEAITDSHLDPDSVEIITHTNHQPAMLTVTGINAIHTPLSATGTSGMGAWVDDVASSFVGSEKDDSASNYGSFDTTDVRRLSFISFADVVLAEQQQQQQQQHQHHQAVSSGGAGGAQESMHLAGLTSLSTMGAMNRSPSPMRSPTATTTTGGLGSSPPTSKSGSIKGLELSPARKARGPASVSSAMGSPAMSPVGAPASSANSTLLVAGSEISVETMSQALRRTGSGELSGLRSLPQSPI